MFQSCREHHRGRIHTMSSLWFLLVLPTVLATAVFQNGSQPLTIPKRVTLDELLQKFNFPKQDLLPATRSKRDACSIPRDVLQELAESIRRILTYSPQPGDKSLAIKEPPAIPESEEKTACDKAKTKLQTNVDSLSTLYLILLTNGASLTDEEFDKLKSLSESLHKKIQDDVKMIKETIDGEVTEPLDEVIQEKASLEARLDRLVKDLDYKFKTKKQLLENAIQLIVADINQGKYKEAKEKFVSLGHTHYIRNVVDKIAENGNYGNYLKFVEELPWLLHRIAGYENMLDKDNIGYSLFTLERNYKELISIKNDPKVVREIQHGIDAVARKLTPQLRDRIDAIVDQIAKGSQNINDLITYSKTEQKAFDPHLNEIVQKVYEQTDDEMDIIAQILSFADKLTIISQSGRVYLTLYKLMDENREISFRSSLQIAFKMKELTMMRNHVNTPTEIKKEMDGFKEKVPGIIKTIIWGQVCIKNELLNGYIHEKGQYDISRKNVALAAEKDLWVFESTDNANSFTIQNVATKDYLYAEGNEMAFNRAKSRIFTWQGNKNRLFNQLWELEDFGWKNGQFLIKNKGRNEYMNAEKLPELPKVSGDVAAELDALMKKDAALATQIKALLEKQIKIDPLQVFTWRRRSRGQNPEWLLIDSEKCQ